MIIEDNSPLPCMEPLRCFLSAKWCHKQLSCSYFGKVFSSDNHKEWEEWLLIPVQDENEESILIQSFHHGKYLYAKSDGSLGAGQDKEKWRLVNLETDGCYNLVSVGLNRALAFDPSRGFHADVDSSSITPCCTLEIKTASGELCFISSPLYNKRILCGLRGNVDTSSEWKGWEIWRFVEAGNGYVYITSWTHSTPRYLSSSPDGTVRTTENRTPWEKWSIQKSRVGDGVEIISMDSKRWLACNSKGEVYTTGDETSLKDCVWQLEPGHQSLYYISSTTQKKQIGSNPQKDGILYTTDNRKESEMWKLCHRGQGLFTFRSESSGKYIGVDLESSSELKINGTSGDSELWYVKYNGSRGFQIASYVLQGHFLALTSQGNLCLCSSTEDLHNNWMLEPVLPGTISGSQMKGIGIIAESTLLTAAVAPLAVVGGVGLLGFGAAGIGAGTPAAMMMSIEAIASGGGVAAGGLVATLQSIGAAGLGFAGTSAALGTGGAIGGILSGMAVRGSGMLGSLSDTVSSSNAVEQSEFNNHHCNRPFCAWRSW